MQVSKASQDVLSVRENQLKRWSESNDDQHDDLSLLALSKSILLDVTSGIRPANWVADRFAHMTQKYNERDRLVHAAALIIAEIERRDRVAAKKSR